MLSGACQSHTLSPNPSVPSKTLLTATVSTPSTRLFDIVHADSKLYLVFEFLDVDLKRYIEHKNKSGVPLSLDLVKVSPPVSYHCNQSSPPYVRATPPAR